MLTVQETYRASDAFWFIPEGTFTLHHIEDITAIFFTIKIIVKSFIKYTLKVKKYLTLLGTNAIILYWDKDGYLELFLST